MIPEDGRKMRRHPVLPEAAREERPYFGAA